MIASTTRISSREKPRISRSGTGKKEEGRLHWKIRSGLPAAALAALGLAVALLGLLGAAALAAAPAGTGVARPAGRRRFRRGAGGIPRSWPALGRQVAGEGLDLGAAVLEALADHVANLRPAVGVGSAFALGPVAPGAPLGLGAAASRLTFACLSGRVSARPAWEICTFSAVAS